MEKYIEVSEDGYVSAHYFGGEPADVEVGAAWKALKESGFHPIDIERVTWAEMGNEHRPWGHWQGIFA